MSSVDVIIINHNTCDHLRNCLLTVINQCRGRVFVVDNASTDASVAMVQQEFPQVTLILNDKNPGYGAAANQAIAQSNTAWVLLLNSDTLLAPDTLNALLNYGTCHPRSAVLGPHLLNTDGTLQASCYPMPTPINIFLEESTLGRYLAHLPVARELYLRTWSHMQARVVPWLLGAVLAIRREAFDAVDGFDEEFFMYLEEVDLCYRLRVAGWEIHFTPCTTVTHIGGASTAQYRGTMAVRYFVSLQQFYDKHFARPQRLIIRLLIIVIVTLRLMRDRLRLLLSTYGEQHTILYENIQNWQWLLPTVALAIFSDRTILPPSKMSRAVTCANLTTKGQPVNKREQDVLDPPLRADWRFLLPAERRQRYQHLVLLGATPALAHQLEGSQLADRISTSLPDPGTADALIVLHGVTVMPSALWERAIACLQPGGVLYIEIDRRQRQHWLLSPQRLQKMLRTHGCGIANVYWVAPNFDRVHRYLPLRVRHILRWYLRNLYVAGTRRHAFIALIMKLLSHNNNHWFSAMVPYYCVTATVAGLAPNTDIASNDGTDVELDNIGLLKAAINAGVVPASTWHPAILTSGYDQGSRTIVLPFKQDGTEPHTVLKVAARTDLNLNTEREQASLYEVRALLSASLRTSIPEPLGLFYYQERAVGAEEYAAGPALAISSGGWRATFARQLDDLNCVAQWTTMFHQQTEQQRIIWDESAITKQWDTLVAAYGHYLSPTPAEQAFFTRVRAYAQTLQGLSLPLVRVHYDLGPWNLYRNPQRSREGEFDLMVGDWEFGRAWPAARFGLPLCDLLYFTTYWLYVVAHVEGVDDELQTFHQFFVARTLHTPQMQAAGRVVDDYLHALEIDRRFVPFLLVYLWMEQAIHQLGRKITLGAPEQDWRQQLKSVHYLMYLAAVAEEFFTAYA